MIVNGETYACAVCIRGHRASACNHHDRPLQHIKKKGRPSSQCQHCRAMRMSRSAHVRCGCGKKSNNGTNAEDDTDACPCPYGGRCICAFKKEPPQPVAAAGPGLDKDSDRATLSRDSSTSPLGNTAVPSDGAPTVEENHTQPLHTTNGTSNGSVGELTNETWEEPASGSSAIHGSHRVHRLEQSEMILPILEQRDMLLPQLDQPTTGHPVPTSFGMFWQLLDTEQPMPGSWLSATTVSLSNYDSYLPQNFDSADFNGMEPLIPTMTDAATATSTLPEFWGIEYSDTDGGRFGHSKALSSGPILSVGIDAAVAPPDMEVLAGHPSEEQAATMG